MKKCNKCFEVREITEFYIAYHQNGRDVYSSNCKQCNIGISSSWRKKNPKRNKEIYRKHALKKKYNISIEEYERLEILQNHLCSICKRPQKKSNHELCVDHCHRTGKLRALLCHRCNTCLGLLSDDLDTVRNMISYLESFQ